MNSLELQRRRRLSQQEYHLQTKFQRFLRKQQPKAEVTLVPSLINLPQFKFLALSLRKQHKFAIGLVLVLLARDKSFHISGKIQRAVGTIYSQALIKNMGAISFLNWDKLSILEQYPDLDINHKFVQNSCLALMKIIYTNFQNGLVLPYLLQRYHNFTNYSPTIDQFWLKFPLSEIDTASQQLQRYLLPMWHNMLISSIVINDN